MWFAIWLLSLAPALPGQNPAELFEKAPPAVEDALRARIRQFYQYHVDGKFRAAEQFVAEESKDDFYSSNKPRCLSFEVPRVDYSEQFTKAKATVICTMFVNMPGFLNKPMPVPLPSFWKVVDDQWYWYLPPISRDTPFGRMNPGDGGTTAQIPTPSLPKGKEIQAVISGVKADRQAVAFRNGEAGAAEVTITNSLQGKIKLALALPKVEGLSAELSEAELGVGQKAVLTIKSAPSESQRSNTVIEIQVSPLGQVIPVQITFGR